MDVSLEDNKLCQFRDQIQIAKGLANIYLLFIKHGFRTFLCQKLSLKIWLRRFCCLNSFLDPKRSKFVINMVLKKCLRRLWLSEEGLKIAVASCILKKFTKVLATGIARDEGWGGNQKGFSPRFFANNLKMKLIRAKGRL